ncbi:hypothetical protein [Cryptosporangium phraense]|uniref:Carboxymuconolactone decarboxylase family protein n=1 Tax=Cryptosporangium phraense TaxID=2593070 RepID=A0A545AKU0_9ACTN|nr:hypothetical protein [Cryptosporangium phraense]TQS41932.1 hypothetical protein FL583_27005 [Cryptosporangium phraense]
MIGYLAEPAPTAESEALFAEDVAEVGYVMNLTRLWAYRPETLTGLFALAPSLSFRQKAILVSATASAFGDPYCALAWGTRLAGVVGAEAAAGVLTDAGAAPDGGGHGAGGGGHGADGGLTAGERAMAGWARTVARNPFGTMADDVDPLRAAGFADSEIFAMTVFVALRMAFSIVNNALGATPDEQLRQDAPVAVREAVEAVRR